MYFIFNLQFIMYMCLLSLLLLFHLQRNIFNFYRTLLTCCNLYSLGDRCRELNVINFPVYHNVSVHWLAICFTQIPDNDYRLFLAIIRTNKGLNLYIQSTLVLTHQYQLPNCYRYFDFSRKILQIHIQTQSTKYHENHFDVNIYQMKIYLI